LGPEHFGIPVAQVDQVIPVAEIGPPAAGASERVRGCIDVHGDVMPVVDLGGRNGAWTALDLEQQFILVHGPAGRLVLLADAVEGVRSVPDYGALADDGVIAIGDVLNG
jgi:chemotaxis signal transduction protein